MHFFFLGEIPGTQSDTRGTNAVLKGNEFPYQTY